MLFEVLLKRAGGLGGQAANLARYAVGEGVATRDMRECKIRRDRLQSKTRARSQEQRARETGEGRQAGIMGPYTA